MNEEDISLIERKLQGNLGTEESEQFNQKMLESKDFANEVLFQKKVLVNLKAKDSSDRKAKMLEDLRNMRKVNKVSAGKVKSMTNNSLYYVMAASIALVISAIAVLNLINSNTSDDTYAAYYQPYEDVVLTRDQQSDIAESLQKYYAEDYREALNDLLRVDQYESITKEEVMLLIANCYLNLNETQKAIEILKSIPANNHTQYSAASQWYLALAYLKIGEHKTSRDLLEKVAASKSVFAGQAKKILQEANLE